MTYLSDHFFSFRYPRALSLHPLSFCFDSCHFDIALCSLNHHYFCLHFKTTQHVKTPDLLA